MIIFEVISFNQPSWMVFKILHIFSEHLIIILFMIWTSLELCYIGSKLGHLLRLEFLVNSPKAIFICPHLKIGSHIALLLPVCISICSSIHTYGVLSFCLSITCKCLQRFMNIVGLLGLVIVATCVKPWSINNWQMLGHRVTKFIWLIGMTSRWFLLNLRLLGQRSRSVTACVKTLYD